MFKDKNILKLSFLFIILRLCFIFTFPPFTDEPVYIRWGKFMTYAPDSAFASIGAHGKSPLVYWLYAVGASFTKSPEIGARFIVLIFSIFSFLFLYKLAEKIENKKNFSYMILFVFSVSPLFIIFQSLAILEGFLIFASILVFYFAYSYYKSPKIKYLIYLGLALGLGHWIKNNFIFPAFVVLFLLMLIIFRSKRQLIVKINHIVLPLVIMLIIVFPLVIQKDFFTLLKEYSYFSFTLTEIFKFPISIWLRNIYYAVIAIPIYFNPLAFLSLILLFLTKREKAKILLLILSVLLTMPPVITGKTFTERYIIFSFIPLLFLFAYGLLVLVDKFPGIKKFIYAFYILYAIYSVIFPLNYFLLFPASTPVEKEREYAYTSGWETRAAADFIEQSRVTNAKIMIAVPDNPGNVSDYLMAKYYFDQNFYVFIATSLNEFDTIRNSSKGPVYYVARESVIVNDVKKYLKEIIRFHKEPNKDSVVIYQII